jgi:hypothetical protein
MDGSLAGLLLREGPVSFIALLGAFVGQIIDVLYGDKLLSHPLFFSSLDFCLIQVTSGQNFSSYEFQ